MEKKQILFILSIFFSFTLQADIIPNPVSAPNLRPLKPTSVRMVSEVVTVDLYKDSSVVEVLFEMKNLGKTETIEVGFPIMDFYYGWKTSLFIGQKSEGGRFRVWIDNEPVEDIKIYGFNFREAAGQEADIAHKMRDILKEDSIKQAEINQRKKQDRESADPSRVPGHIYIPDYGRLDIQPWYIWNTTFPKGETRWVKVSYSLPPGLNKRYNFFNYILHTGASWNKTIGKATVNIKIHDIPGEKIKRITPDGYLKDGNILTWIFTDFEPSRRDDIFIYYEKENAKRKAAEADVYLDNEKSDLNLIEPEDIAYFNVIKNDTLNYPNGAVFIHSKDFEFKLLKEFIKKFSFGIFKELSELSTNEFYQNYEVKIEGRNTRHSVSANELSAIEDNINQIIIIPNGSKRVITAIADKP